MKTKPFFVNIVSTPNTSAQFRAEVSAVMARNNCDYDTAWQLASTQHPELIAAMHHPPEISRPKFAKSVYEQMKEAGQLQ